MKVLLVEDEVIMAMLMRRGLSSIGYDVFEPVATGEDAIREAGATRPDVILMDIRLAGRIDGLEAARAIIAQHGTPVIFVSGYLDAAMMNEARALKAPYLTKPVSPTDVDNAIKALFSR